MKVQHKKTGRVAEVLSQDEKLVKVHFIKEDVDQDMTVSTFKRWWKPVENEDVAGDGTPLAEVGKEIVEQAKQKAEAAKKTPIKKEKVIPKTKSLVDSSKADAVRDYVLDYVGKQSGEVFTPANGMKMRTFKVGGKMYGRMDFSSKKVTLSFRGDSIKELGLTADNTRNHMFDKIFYISELTEDAKKKISSMLDAAMKYQKTKNESSKTSKKSKKEAK